MTRNQIDYWSYVESKRHNQEVEKEQHRAARANEVEQQRRNRADERIRRETNIINSTFNEQRSAETQRHNYATELATVQSLENERARNTLGYYSANLGLESARVAAGVGYANVGLGYANLAENQRHSLEMEATNRINAQTNFGNLGVNARNMLLSEQKQKFEVDKWNQTGKLNVQSQTASNVARAQLSTAQTSKTRKETSYVAVNAASNLLGAASRLIKPIGGKK